MLDTKPIAADFYVPGSELGSFKRIQKWEEAPSKKQTKKSNKYFESGLGSPEISSLNNLHSNTHDNTDAL